MPSKGIFSVQERATPWGKSLLSDYLRNAETLMPPGRKEKGGGGGKDVVTGKISHLNRKDFFFFTVYSSTQSVSLHHEEMQDTI